NGAGRDALVGSRSKDVVKDLQEAFEKDPGLRARLIAKPPASAEDEQLQKDFDKAVHQAVSKRDCEKYIKPLMETGRLPIEKQMELEQSLVDDDEQATYKDLVALAKDKSPEARVERDKILSDTDYQNKVLGFLSKDERAIALKALKQGETRPEDKLRSYMVGAGTGEGEIKQELAKIRDRDQYKKMGLSEEQIDKAIQKRLEEVKHAYAVKYGSDLTTDLLDELGGEDAREAKRAMLRNPASAQEAFDRARDEHYESYDGIGKSWTNRMWDGTGYQT